MRLAQNTGQVETKVLLTMLNYRQDCSLLGDRVAKSNGDVRILTGRSEVVCRLRIMRTFAQYKFGQNSPKQLARRRAAPSGIAFAIASFLVTVYCQLSLASLRGR